MIAGFYGNVDGLAIAGDDPSTARPYVHFSPYAGGWGARADKDGLSTTGFPSGLRSTPTEVSGLVAFLLSDRASYITGASIDVAGGMGKYV